MNTLSLGLIAGRHPLPVDGYLLAEADAAPAATPALFRALHERILRLPVQDGDRVRLYLTGLTRAALIAADLIRQEHPGVLLELVEYDQATGEYVPTLFLVGDAATHTLGRLLPVGLAVPA